MIKRKYLAKKVLTVLLTVSTFMCSVSTVSASELSLSDNSLLDAIEEMDMNEAEESVLETEADLETEALSQCTIKVSYSQSFARNELFKAICDWRADKNNWNYYGKTCEYDPVFCHYDYTLEKLAMKRAAEQCVLWGHTRPNGKTAGDWDTNGGIYYFRFGENLDQRVIKIGMSNEELARLIVQDFAEDVTPTSQPHRKSFVQGSYDRVGIGVCSNGYSYYICVLFGNENNEEIQGRNNR